MLSVIWHLCNVLVKIDASFTGVPVVLFVLNAIVTVLGLYCSQLPLVPVQCAVSFIIYSGPIWSDKPSPSSEVITNNNDDKTQRIFALFWKWLFCVAWWCFLPLSGVAWQPFANLLPSDLYRARASGSSFGMGTAPFHHPCWPSVGRGEVTVRAVDSWPSLWQRLFKHIAAASFACCQNIKRKAGDNTVSTTNTA